MKNSKPESQDDFSYRISERNRDRTEQNRGDTVPECPPRASRGEDCFMMLWLQLRVCTCAVRGG